MNLSAASPASEPEFGFLVREGFYDPSTPREKWVKIVATVPDLGAVSMLLPLDAACTLLVDGATPWPTVIDRAMTIRASIGAAPRADMDRLAVWLAVDTNRAAYAAAWAQHRARRLRRQAKRTLVVLGEHCHRWGLPMVNDAELVDAAESDGAR